MFKRYVKLNITLYNSVEFATIDNLLRNYVKMHMFVRTCT